MARISPECIENALQRAIEACALGHDWRSRKYSESYLDGLERGKGALQSCERLLHLHRFVDDWMVYRFGRKPEHNIEDLRNLRNIARSEAKATKATCRRVVYASKVLHFMNPSKFPIWDRAIRRALGCNAHIESWNRYQEWQTGILELSDEWKERATNRYRELAGYVVLPVRAVEALIFEASRI